jgi:threonine synthase
MKYISTRGNAPALDFRAPRWRVSSDGGLYVPRNLADLHQAEIAAMAGCPMPNWRRGSCSPSWAIA